MKYIVDIDHTICQNTNSDYANSCPMTNRIQQINDLYDQGHTVIYWTARGGNSGLDWSELTKSQLQEWGCKYHQLSMGKPVYDVWIDDRAINSEDFFQ